MAINEEPLQSAGFASDLIGLPCFLFDPEGAAKRVHSKWFWLVPTLILGAIGIGVALYIFPLAMHVAELTPPADGVTADQQAKGLAIGRAIGKVVVYFSPFLAAGFWALMALVMLGITYVTSVKARFVELLNLVSGCSVIQTLAAIATAVIIHFKGEPATQAELKPPMGLDILLPEGANKFLMAFAGNFSVFQIWWVVMMVLIFAAAFRTGKGKAFAVVFPLWLIGAIYTTALAFFQH